MASLSGVVPTAAETARLLSASIHLAKAADALRAVGDGPTASAVDSLRVGVQRRHERAVAARRDHLTPGWRLGLQNARQGPQEPRQGTTEA